MNLEPTIQSEVSQKDKYSIQHIYMESRKMVLKKLLTGEQLKHREQTYGHGERGGEDEMYGRSNIETSMIICKIDSQWEFAVWLGKLLTGALYQLRLVGWGGRWGGSKGRGYMCIYG